ncbi:HEAT repeat domain-containing protein [Prochlorothrix hollandica]|uniref:PBS lyase n=1 Tax=Prochlorothrix hollandica PCC 9006 = CALU 1027 TaxID=317619 RepID=A0A0M2PWQ0_PROHO|nr:HEAT repeat domain-containing protein [Prochlorothrix hollandica]KKI99108.1 hypothetical protein PROH_15115 [Prochlorothrix hollandica PCC 9006 = CALU 1027]
MTPSPPAITAESPSPTSLQPLIQQLQGGDFHEKWNTMKALVQLGDVAIDPLLACLADLDLDPLDLDPLDLGPLDLDPENDEEDSDETLWELPWFIAQTLGQIRHPRALTALVHLVHHHPSREVAQVAATALAHLGEAALPALRALIQEPATRLHGVQALAHMRDPGVVDLLLEAVTAEESSVRALAIEALGGFLDPRIAPAFAQALQDPMPQVRQGAIVGVGLRSSALDSTWLIQQLSPLLWDLNLAVACQAATALGRLGLDAGVAPLLSLLDLPVALPLQRAAIQALNTLATTSALQGLETYLWVCLDRPEAMPQALAQEILGSLGTWAKSPQRGAAIALLLRFLQNTTGNPDHSTLKQLAAHSLGQLGHDSTLPALILLLGDPHGGVRLHAIAALKQINGDRALAQLHHHQQHPQAPWDSPPIQAGIALALAEWHP